MFISKEEKRELKMEVKDLKTQMINLREQVSLLLDHLKLEVEIIPTAPSKTVLVKKGKSKNRPNHPSGISTISEMLGRQYQTQRMSR